MHPLAHRHAFGTKIITNTSFETRKNWRESGNISATIPCAGLTTQRTRHATVMAWTTSRIFWAPMCRGTPWRAPGVWTFKYVVFTLLTYLRELWHPYLALGKEDAHAEKGYRGSCSQCF